MVASLEIRKDVGMKIVVSGASGLLGDSLVKRLRHEGHDVTRLIRRPARAADEATWNPQRGELDPELLAGVDAVVNLSGAGLFGKRWSTSYKREIRSSRVDATTTIAKAIAAAKPRPRVLLNASGIHFYGDTGDRIVDETSPSGTGFMPETAVVWEAATQPAADAGARVVLLRTAPVLSARDGMLKQMLLPFRLGIGGKLGSGRQYMSWISLADWVSAVVFLLDHEVAGPVNITSPHPVTNAEFTRMFASVLHRPAVMPVPAFGLRLVLGEVSMIALDSLRVVPRVLTEQGFQFQHPELKPALMWALRN